jgi:CubicO group peptidase (beta-lactamase class C family)
VSIRVGGEVVVDLWGGIADGRTGAPWTRDTATVVFSVTKGLVSLLAARLVQEGRLDYEAPVADYWPEYAAAGKESTLVRQLLSHQAGLSAPIEDWTVADILDAERTAASLAGQRPLWPPGQGYSYHAVTFGWLAGELIRRVTGRSVGEHFRETIAEPLGADAWIGLPASQEGRVAHVERRPEPEPEETDPEQTDEDREWGLRSYTLGGALPAELISPDGGFNDPRVHAAEVAGAGGIATARALATIWSSAITETEGLRLLTDPTIDAATKVQSEGRPVLGGLAPFPRWGMGFQLFSTPPKPRYLGPGSFGHDGAGGQISFADRDLEIGFGYVTNYMDETDSSRGLSLVEALRASL